MTRYPQTPAQTVGPFFHDGLLRLAVDDLDPQQVAGRPIQVHGRVLDGDGAPIDDAMLEVWQPDGDGRYQHPLDPRRPEVPDGFLGFGRIPTADDGTYRFDTASPGPVPGPAGTTQAPHLNLLVFARGLLDLLSTRLYFPDLASANAEDPVLSAVPESRRPTLIATAEAERDGRAVFRFDVVLRGPGETVFFEL